MINATKISNFTLLFIILALVVGLLISAKAQQGSVRESNTEFDIETPSEDGIETKEIHIDNIIGNGINEIEEKSDSNENLNQLSNTSLNVKIDSYEDGAITNNTVRSTPGSVNPTIEVINSNSTSKLLFEILEGQYSEKGYPLYKLNEELLNESKISIKLEGIIYDFEKNKEQEYPGSISKYYSNSLGKLTITNTKESNKTLIRYRMNNGIIGKFYKQKNNIYYLVEIRETSFPDEGDDPEFSLGGNQDFFNTQLRMNYDLCNETAECNNSITEILVLYTDAAMNRVGNIEDEIEENIDVFNTVNSESGLNHTVALSGMINVNYDERDLTTGNMRSDLTLNNISFMPNLRSDLEADIVVLLFDNIIADNQDACGKAWINRNNNYYDPSSGFCVVDVQCMRTQFSLVHEVGHILGLWHDRYVLSPASENNAACDWMFGYVNENASSNEANSRVRTVMAYNKQCDESNDGYDFCRRLGLWSNPNINFPNTEDPAGRPRNGFEPADAAYALNRAFCIVSGFSEILTCDDYEPNDREEDATTVLGIGGNSLSSTSLNSKICHGRDEDWYSANLQENGELLVSLTNLPANYQIEAYGENGQLLGSSYNTTTQNESMSICISSLCNVSGSEEVLIYVFGDGYDPDNYNSTSNGTFPFNGAFDEENEYTIGFQWTPDDLNVLGTCSGVQCQEDCTLDEYEPNGNIEAANGELSIVPELSILGNPSLDIMQNSATSLDACVSNPSDVDWYLLGLTGGGVITATLTSQERDLDLVLGSPLHTSNTDISDNNSTATESVSECLGMSCGQIYIGVRAGSHFNGTSSTYSLDFEWEANNNCRLMASNTSEIRRTLNLTANSESICDDESTVLTVSGGSGNHAWWNLNTNTLISIGGSSIPISPNITTQYMVVDLDETICTEKPTITIEVTDCGGGCTNPTEPVATYPIGSCSSPTIIGTLTPNFQWNVVPGATTYDIFIAKESSCSNAGLIYQVDCISGTSHTLNPAFYDGIDQLEDGERYRWNMVANTLEGNDCDACHSNHTTAQYFEVELDDNTCNIPTGLQTLATFQTSASITWSPPTPAPTAYTIKYREQGTTNWIYKENVSTTNDFLSNLDCDTDYEWQIRSQCGSNISGYSSSSYFTTDACPSGSNDNDDCSDAIDLGVYTFCNPVIGNIAAATQTYPATYCDGATSSLAQDVWHKFVALSEEATIYVDPSQYMDAVVEVRRGSCSGTIVGCEDDGGGNGLGMPETLELNDLDIGETYYVRVFHYTESNNTPSSTSFSICVYVDEIVTSDCDTPNGLSDDEDDESFRVEVSWNHINPRPDYYEVRLEYPSGSEDIFTSSSNSLIMLGFACDVNYYWSVRSVCSDGPSNWSSTRSINLDCIDNDDCDDAVELFVGETCRYITGSVQGADADAPVTHCNLNYPPSNFVWDVWYKFVATDNDLTIKVDPSSGLDIIIDLREGSCSGTSIDCADFGGGFGDVEYIYADDLDEGETYFVRVFPFGISATPSTYDFGICIYDNNPYCLEAENLHVDDLEQFSVKLDWRKPDFDPDFYRVGIREDGGQWDYYDTDDTYLELDNLDCDTEYDWAVLSICGYELSEFTNIENFTTDPCIVCEEPEDTEENNIGQTNVELDWDEVASAENYRVRIREQGGSWGDYYPNDPDFIVNGLDCGTTYEWRVRAECDGDNSDYSNTRTFTTDECDPECLTPSISSVSSITASSAIVSWPFTTSIADEYVLSYQSQGDSSWVTTTTSNLSVAIQDLDCGTMYEYRIKTICGNESTNWTTIQTFTTEACVTECNVPSTPVVNSIDENSVQVTWTAVNPSPDYYVVHYKKPGSTGWIYGSTANNTMNIGDLDCGSDYILRVRSQCANLESEWSETIAFATNDCPIICDIPYNTITSNIDRTSAILAWVNSINLPVSDTTIFNELYFREVGATTWLIDTSLSSFIYVDGLECEMDYEWKVRFHCPSDISAFTAIEAFTTIDCNDCTVPIDITTINIGQNTATLNWWNGPWTGCGVGIPDTVDCPPPYNEVEWREQGSSSWINDTTNSFSYELDNLNCASTYEWRVKKICSDTNMSEYSEIQVFTTSDCLDCINWANQPTTLNITQTSATLTSEPGFDPPEIPEPHYQFKYKQTNAPFWSWIFFDSISDPSLTLVDLECGVEYEWQMKKVCANGSTDWIPSPPLIFSTLDCNLCASQSNIEVIDVNYTSVTVEWENPVIIPDGPNGDTINPFVPYSEVYWREWGETSWQIDTTSDSTFLIQGLTCSKSYEVQLVFVCDSNSSSNPTLPYLFSTEDCPVAGCDPIRDSLILLTFYSAMDGPNWTIPWNLSEPMNSWYGITLSPEGCVTSIYEYDNNLTGVIPDELGSLEMLSDIQLGANNITGSIPETIGQLNLLRSIYLPSNQLVGDIPISFGNLPNLELLHLSNNNLSGNIPIGFQSSSKIKMINVAGNNLTGLPDLSAIQSWTHGLLVRFNELTFEDVLPNISIVDSLFEYSNQAYIGQTQTINLVNGESYNIDLVIDETISSNIYTWYKNNVLHTTINGNNELEINNVVASDAGVYRCEVTNPNAPELTLYSRNTTIVIDPCGGGYNLLVEEYSCNPSDTGEVVNTFTTSSGCDSTVTVQTNLLPSYDISIAETTCDSALAGVEILNLSTQSGCDSIITITTELLYSFDMLLTEYSCEVSDTGTVVQSFVTSDGCDSLITTITLLQPSYDLIITEITCNPFEDTTYFSGSSQFGCDSNVTIIPIYEPVSPIVFNELDSVECGSSFIYDTSSVNTSNASYNWTNGSTDALIEVTQTGWYGLEVEYEGGCSFTDSVYVNIHPYPIAYFEYEINGDSVTFTDGSQFADASLILFGDGTSSNNVDTLHEYEELGQYIVQLIASNYCGSDEFIDTINIGGVTNIIDELFGKVTIYPNPASDFIRIELGDNSPLEVEFNLFNNLAQQMSIQDRIYQVGHGSYSINVNGFDSGSYYLNIIFRTENVAKGFTVIIAR